MHWRRLGLALLATLAVASCSAQPSGTSGGGTQAGVVGWVSQFDGGVGLLQLTMAGTDVKGTSSWVYVVPPQHQLHSLSTAVSGLASQGTVSLNLNPAPFGVAAWQGQMTEESLVLTYQRSDGTVATLEFGRSTVEAFNASVNALEADQASANAAEGSCSVQYANENALVLVTGADSVAECGSILATLRAGQDYPHWDDVVAPAAEPLAIDSPACSGRVDGFQTWVYDSGGKLYGGVACDLLGLGRQ
jgi:hypothetical protein